MATSPSPFFFATIAPAYVPTAVFSPPPFGYGAPTYDHFIFPSAATYPPPFSPDGYSTPSSGSPNWPPPAAYPTPAAAYPPAFPYAVASPTQVSGFSPNWQTWPPPSLGPTPSTFPSTTTSSPQNLPVASGVFFPQPAPLIPAIEMADQSLFVDMTSDGAPTGRLVMAQPRDGSSASRMQPDLEPLLKLTNADRPILTEMEPLLTAPTSQQIIPCTVPNTGIFPGSDLFGSTSHAPVFGNTAALSAATTAPTATPSAKAQACAEAVVLDIKRRLEEHQAQSQCSLDSLQGELYKIRDRLSSLTTSVSNTTTASTRSVCFTLSSGSTTAISTVSVAPAYVAPELLDEMPQYYGFHNLNHHSLFRADGTECSYFTLPADYPLERTTPPMSHSAAQCVSVAVPPFVAAHTAAPKTTQDTSNVCKEMSVFDIYDEDHYCLNGMDEQLAKCFHKASENACSEQLLKCSSKKLKTEQTIACLYYALEQQQNDEKVAVYVQQRRDPSLKVLVTHEIRKEWDPGVHTILSSTPTRDIVGSLQTSILPRSGIFIPKDALAVRFQFGVPKCCVRQHCYCRVPSRLIYHVIQFLWDPGILNQMQVKLGETTVANIVHSMQTPFNLLSSVGQPIDLNCNSLNAFLQVKYCCLLIVWNCLYSESVRQLVCYASLFSSTTMSVVKLHFTCPSEALVGNSLDALLWSQCPVFADLQYNSIAFCIWDPGIGTSSSISHWLQNLTATTDNTLSSLQTPEPTTWLSQVSSASYAWDPGTMLLLYKSICLLLLREEKEKATLVPKQWIFWFNDVHYCQIFQKCREMSPLMYWHHDIKFSEIALWLITFNPP